MAAHGASLGDLPEATLLRIFAYLSPEDVILGIRPTCQYFHELSFLPELWKDMRMTITSCDADRPNYTFSKRSQNFYLKLFHQQCTRRRISGTESESDDSDTVPVKDKVRFLEERGDVWPDLSVTSQMVYPNLQSLTLIKCKLPQMDFLADYSGLAHLSVEVKQYYGDLPCPQRGCLVAGMFESLTGLKGLQTLKFICAPTGRTCRCGTEAAKKAMMDYFSTKPLLRRIHLSHFVTDKILRSILEHCKRLEDFALFHLDDRLDCFGAFSEKPRPLLTSLRLVHCKKLDDGSLRDISLAFPNLNTLELTRTFLMTDDGLGPFLKSFSQLSSLKVGPPSFGEYVSQAHTNTGSLRRTHFRHCLELPKNKKLESLVVEHFDIYPHVVKALCEDHQNLHTLELTKCTIESHHLMDIADSCLQLRTVRIMDCLHVEFKAVAYLMKKLPHLKTLACELRCKADLKVDHLQASRKRSRSGQVVLLEQPKEEGELHSLELHAFSRLSMVGVSALISPYPGLLRLELHAVRGVSDVMVKDIVRTCRQLQSLRLVMLSAKPGRDTLTVDSLAHIQRWGKCLRDLQLMANTSFSEIALAKFLARSATIMDCTVSLLDSKRDQINFISEAMKVEMNKLSGGIKGIEIWSSWSKWVLDHGFFYFWSLLNVHIHHRTRGNK